MKRKTEKQFGFSGVSGWGGKRIGAGRPNLLGQVNHMKRPKIDLKTPLHITLRLKEKLPSLRKKQLLEEFKNSIKGAKKLGLYVIQFSIQSNHIHLFCESGSNRALAVGMRAVASRFGKIVRNYSYSRGSEKAGSVFRGRYHLHVLKTPREVRNALEYVLLNLSKHQKLIEYVDNFSSGKSFREWRKLLGTRFTNLIKLDVVFWEQHDPADLIDVLSPPRSWLARSGWMRSCN